MKKEEYSKRWREANPKKVLVTAQEQCRKGGKHYVKHLKYLTTGIPKKKQNIRRKHANQYRTIKEIIAPKSQIHHEWIPGTAEYIGVALVETKPHRYGIIDVIKILEGKITLFKERK